MELEQIDNAIKVDDLYLAGFLACKNIMPKSILKEGRSKKFVYDDTDKEEAQRLIDAFYKDEVSVCLPLLRARIKDMKELFRSPQILE